MQNLRKTDRYVGAIAILCLLIVFWNQKLDLQKEKDRQNFLNRPLKSFTDSELIVALILIDRSDFVRCDNLEKEILARSSPAMDTELTKAFQTQVSKEGPAGKLPCDLWLRKELPPPTIRVLDVLRRRVFQHGNEKNINFRLLLSQIKSPHPAVRAAAAGMLREEFFLMPENKNLLTNLLSDCIRDKCPDVARSAVDSLFHRGKLAENSELAWKFYLTQVNSPSSAIRIALAGRLRESFILRPENEAALLKTLPLLCDTNSNVVADALLGLRDNELPIVSETYLKEIVELRGAFQRLPGFFHNPLDDFHEKLLKGRLQMSPKEIEIYKIPKLLDLLETPDDMGKDLMRRRLWVENEGKVRP
jgi:hypothetical protein